MCGGTHAGLAMFEQPASGIEVVQAEAEQRIEFFAPYSNTDGPLISQMTVQLRVHIEDDQACCLFSLNDRRPFQPLGPATFIYFSWWKGSRPALFAYTTQVSSAGIVDFDWAHYQPPGVNPW